MFLALSQLYLGSFSAVLALSQLVNSILVLSELSLGFLWALSTLIKCKQMNHILMIWLKYFPVLSCQIRSVSKISLSVLRCVSWPPPQCYQNIEQKYSQPMPQMLRQGPGMSFISFKTNLLSVVKCLPAGWKYRVFREHWDNSETIPNSDWSIQITWPEYWTVIGCCPDSLTHCKLSPSLVKQLISI